MPKTILFHLGSTKDGIYARQAWYENRNFLIRQSFHHPDPYYEFATPLRNLIRHSPKISPNTLPMAEPCIEKFRAYLKNAASQGSPRVLYIHFAYSVMYPQELPILHSLVQNVFPQARIKAFFSLARQDINLMAMCRYREFFKKDGASEQITVNALQRGIRFTHTPVLHEIVATFGGENLECFVSDPPSDAPVDMRRDALLAQEAFWHFAGVDVPLDPETGLACFRPRLELCLPPEFHAFCRSCNIQSIKPYPRFTSPWAEQSLHFRDEGSFFSSFSPTERASFVAEHEGDNARAAALLGRDHLFTPVDVNQPWEPFTGLTEENAFQVAARLDRDFALARMAEFDACPDHYLGYEQRLCRQALHDALDPPSAMPLPRTKREEPKLSVLTLTYNHAPYIAECIESVIAQKTDFPIQHIIADDASDDGTQEIILEYAAKYPHIVPVFQKKNRGSQNVRTLFGMARTEYVALCDGDDYFTDPAKLQSQVDFLETNPGAALCFHVVRVIYEDDPARERLYPPIDLLPRGVRPFYYLSELVACNLIQTNSVMYRWRFKNGLPDWFRADLMPGDWYWHLLHAETGKIGFINTVMSVYRRHKKSVFYLSEVDRLKHRYTVGKKELESYDAINKHFKGRFESTLLSLVNGVFVDCLLYDTHLQETGSSEEPVLPQLADKYPDFARHFLSSLKLEKKSNPRQA